MIKKLIQSVWDAAHLIKAEVPKVPKSGIKFYFEKLNFPIGRIVIFDVTLDIEK